MSEKVSHKLLGKSRDMNRKVEEQSEARRSQLRHQRMHKYFEGEGTGYLEAEEREKTLQFRQHQLAPLLPQQNAKDIFTLDLDFGDYSLDFARDGKHLLLGSSLGHVALMDWGTKRLKTEFHLKNRVRAA